MRNNFLLFYLAVLTAAWVNPTFAQEKNIQLKMSNWMPAQHPVNPALQAWIDDLNKATGGTVSGKLFSSEQLGKAFDQYDMARDGIADFALAVPGYQPGRFPVMAATSLPFLVANGKGGTAAIDAWYRQYAAKEMKDVHFCFGFVSEPFAYHSQKKIQAPEDLRELKIRPSSSTIAQMNTVLGATNVQGSVVEAREMLERGVADAVTFPWDGITTFGLDKAVKYHLDAPIFVVSLAWVMNKDKYESLSITQKKIIDDHCTSEWAEKVVSPWVDFLIAARLKVAAQSEHVFTKLTPDQLAQWRKAVAPVEAQWNNDVRKAGYDPKVVLDGLKQSLAKHKAAL